MQQTLTNGDIIISADIDGRDYTHVTSSIILHPDGTIEVLNT